MKHFLEIILFDENGKISKVRAFLDDTNDHNSMDASSMEGNMHRMNWELPGSDV